jgi:hypothetical protein
MLKAYFINDVYFIAFNTELNRNTCKCKDWPVEVVSVLVLLFLFVVEADMCVIIVVYLHNLSVFPSVIQF